MKQVQRYCWAIVLLVAVLLSANDSRQGNDSPCRPASIQLAATSVVTPQDTRHHEATLNDATNLYRVCSSRPQRILPIQGSKTERSTNTCNFLRRNIVNPLNLIFDSRCRLETAPFCLSASCHYYVIALRHIIR